MANIPMQYLNLPAIDHAKKQSRLYDMQAEQAPLQTEALELQNEATRQKLDSDKELAGYKDLYAAVKWADTPEKWNQAVDSYARMGVPNIESYRDQFGNRGLLLSQLEVKLGVQSSGPMSGPGKVQADINAGLLPPGTPLRGKPITVNLPGEPKIGTIPPGYEAVQDKGTGAWSMRPIPGGPADRDIEAEKAKAEGRQNETEFYGGVVMEDGYRVLAKVGESPNLTTSWGAYLKDFPGPAMDVAELIGPLKANIGFDRLQRMRNNNPTGGALGNVSNFEVDTLQKTQGSLKQEQSTGQLIFNTSRVMAMYDAIINRPAGVVSSEEIDGSAEGRQKFNEYVQKRQDAILRETGWYDKLLEAGELRREAKPEPPKRLKYNPQTGEFE